MMSLPQGAGMGHYGSDYLACHSQQRTWMLNWSMEEKDRQEPWFLTCHFLCVELGWVGGLESHLQA